MPPGPYAREPTAWAVKLHGWRFIDARMPVLRHLYCAQVVMGGGQDASQVTTTAAQAGGFEARFFHKVSSMF